MDIMLTDKKSLVAPSVLVQARQSLGADAVKQVFLTMAEQSYDSDKFETWAGLNLLAVDGVVWRTADTPENHDTFKAQSNSHGENIFLKVRMICNMEVTSHQLINSAFSDYIIYIKKLSTFLLYSQRYIKLKSSNLFCY